jgi:dihydroorotate dehydrogenase
MPAEPAHDFAFGVLGRAPGAWARLLKWWYNPASALPTPLGRMMLRNPVGLAAGLDKDGRAVPVWAALGFGFVEVGTVTAHPQPGNPRPRLFRLEEQRALINRMGFNNQGSAVLAARLGRLRQSGAWPSVPVGANLGKSKVTALEHAAGDYALSASRLRAHVDYFTVNVSSPNTPGLRSLQQPDELRRILAAVQEAAPERDVLLKLAPDLEDEALEQAIRVAVELGTAGIVAFNTTVRRPEGYPEEAGGLSGPPLWPLLQQRVGSVLRAAGRVPVVAVGGIERPEQVQELLSLGCRAIQLYTGLVFHGPSLPGRLLQAIGAQR